MPDFYAREFDKVPKELLSKPEWRVSPKVLQRGRSIVIFESGKPIGGIAYSANTILALAAPPHKQFFESVGHSVGEELVRHFLNKHRFDTFRHTVEEKKMERVLAPILPKGVWRIGKTDNYAMATGVRVDLQPKLELRR